MIVSLPSFIRICLAKTCDLAAGCECLSALTPFACLLDLASISHTCQIIMLVTSSTWTRLFALKPAQCLCKQSFIHDYARQPDLLGQKLPPTAAEQCPKLRELARSALCPMLYEFWQWLYGDPGGCQKQTNAKVFKTRAQDAQARVEPVKGWLVWPDSLQTKLELAEALRII